MTNTNIVWYVLCWNEMPILPFMIDYWKQIATKVIVYDNNSTDGSIDYLKQFDWIEVRPYTYKTDDTLNDDIHRKIKNECWKECKGKNVDWVVVSDLDEIIWARNLKEILIMSKMNNVSIPIPTGYDFVSLDFPNYDGNLLHDLIKTCVHIPMWDKPIIFDPDLVSEISYCPGGHWLENPVYSGIKTKIDNLYLFHFKYLSIDYLINKRLATKPRMSQDNLNNKWGFEYLFDKDQIVLQFNGRWENAKNFSVDNLK